MKYENLIIAGLGKMGKAFLTLGQNFITQFPNVYLLEKTNISKDDIIYDKIDIDDESSLRNFLVKLKGNSLFVNLTSNIDTVKLRKILKDYQVAYIDTACSTKTNEWRFPKLMEYTNIKLCNNFPYFLGCGVNPGMVELIFIYIVKKYFVNEKKFSVFLYEYDNLRYANRKSNSPVIVAWSKEDLIDEFVHYPTIKIEKGNLVETNLKETNLNWFGQNIKSYMIGHEEIWNLSKNKHYYIENCSYKYSLNQNIDFNINNIELVNDEDLICGQDGIVIKVKGNKKMITFMWQLSHKEMFDKYKINAVQYQVIKSLFVFLEILMSEKNGVQKNALDIAYTLDINYIEKLLKKHQINWEIIDSKLVF